MSTPLFAAAKEYLDGAPARFHMPGHKGMGIPFLGDGAQYDLSEVTGLDSLYQAEGAIAGTESAYTELYKTKTSLLSAGGSTLCIQAMLTLACPPGSKVIAARGVHVAAVNTMALLDLHPVWLWPQIDDATGLAQGIGAAEVDALLRDHPDAAAVYLTSPTYFGVLSDIEEVSVVCRKHGVPLLVDNAHGAHLRFLSPALHPVGLGADLCCDSLHKTLPVLTGGALLHITADRYMPRAKERMALFGSTSPSYLIMLSADTALPYLRESVAADLVQVCNIVDDLKGLARERGFLLPNGLCDPVRLTDGFRPLGYDREGFARHLASCGVEPEYLGDAFCVFLPGGMNSEKDFARLRKVIDSANPTNPTEKSTPQQIIPTSPPETACSPREALFAASELVPVDEAGVRVAGGMVSPCPPGIPLFVPGERIDKTGVQTLKNGGILAVNVLK